ncbi:hypothetical protein ACNPQM_41730 [Streptomyces sp. NPDC056231]|uniref:LexA family protein n=1 Tax=Streptomyces sp. NPDC056231 TaxID=3345755 RepID=UPI003AADB2E2
MSADRLTAWQESVLRAIRDAIADTGDAPTIREIGRRVGLSSAGSAAWRSSA